MLQSSTFCFILIITYLPNWSRITFDRATPYSLRRSVQLPGCIISIELLIFRSRKKFSTAYAIVSFFFSRPFHENFEFLKNCPYDFHKILNSYSTLKGAPACSKASKLYDWNVGNIAKISRKTAKISPKTAKISPKTAIFRLFSIFSKTVHTIERNFLQSFYTILESYMCNGIKIVWLGCGKHSQN